MENTIKSIITSRGYHVYRFTAWKYKEKDQLISSKFEKRSEALDINPHAIAVSIFPREKVAHITVGYIPHELSRVFYYFIKRGGTLSGRVYSTNYVPSPIPQGGLEIPLEVIFE